jgi:hypothetical protein
MTVTSEVRSTATCDAKRCHEKVTYTSPNGPDQFHSEPWVPESWTAVLFPKHGDYSTFCPYHSRPNPKCGSGLGERPGWMGVDQWDPCPCDQPMNHEGDCSCSHLRNES